MLGLAGASATLDDLSGATFSITNLRLSSTRLKRNGGQITVRADVKNTGAVTGDEVVQLYIHDPVATYAQPVRRLRGFSRVTLSAGQHKTVTFTLGTADVGFYDNQAQFRVEPGQIEVYVGNSSAATLGATIRVV